MFDSRSGIRFPNMFDKKKGLHDPNVFFVCAFRRYTFDQKLPVILQPRSLIPTVHHVIRVRRREI